MGRQRLRSGSIKACLRSPISGNPLISFYVCRMFNQLRDSVLNGQIKGLSRCISLVENEVPGYDTFLQELPPSKTPIIGITGPPGAGKSTLVDALIGLLTGSGKKVGVLCVDPSSPFNLGALLGDRIRMSEWYSNPNVFIRSLATRGSLGGLHPKMIELCSIMQAAGFDYIIVETVGVGQSEIEIAGLADTTVVVVVPEAGDEVQTMKAGLMEIADIFVVNKADRPEADLFVRNLRQMLAPAYHRQHRDIAVVKTIASKKEGLEKLWQEIETHLTLVHDPSRKYWLLAERAWQLIQHKKMQGFNKLQLKNEIAEIAAKTAFNLYRFIAGK